MDLPKKLSMMFAFSTKSKKILTAIFGFVSEGLNSEQEAQYVRIFQDIAFSGHEGPFPVRRLGAVVAFLFLAV